MKKLLLIISLIIFFSACTSTKVYFVRHAEKSTEPADDPNLTEEGRLRAEALSSTLRKDHIMSIYSTGKNRTRQTAEPLSKRMNVPVQYYDNDTILKFLVRVLAENRNVLIVGHSNTLLPMLKALELQPSISEIPDNDYDNLFIVKVKRKSPAGYDLKLNESTYGKRSPAKSDTSTTMMMK